MTQLASPGAGFCFAQPQPVPFQLLETGRNRKSGRLEPWVPDKRFVGLFDGEKGNSDLLLDNTRVWPERGQLGQPTPDPDAAELFRKLRELAARPVNLEKAPVIVPTIPSYGVGATIASLVYPMLEALAQNATLYAPPMAAWTSPSCPQRDLTCYFDSLPSLQTTSGELLAAMLPRSRLTEKRYRARERALQKRVMVSKDDKSAGALTPQILCDDDAKSDSHLCSVATANPGGMTMARAPTGALLPTSFDLTPDFDFDTPESTKPLGIELSQFNVASHALYNETKLATMLPARWLRRGRFWLVSNVLRFLTTPNAALLAKLNAARAGIGPMEEPVLAVHVRKGDACEDRGECRSLRSYMPVVETMIEKYGYKTVFLATPDPGVLAEVKDYPHINFKFAPTTNTTAVMKARSIRSIDTAVEKGVIDAGEEFEMSMISSYLLADSAGFVGGFSSTAARLAYSLSVSGESSCLKPFDSFDINWCAAFGKGGGNVIRRGSQSCDAAGDSTKGLPCQISC